MKIEVGRINCLRKPDEMRDIIAEHQAPPSQTDMLCHLEGVLLVEWRSISRRVGQLDPWLIPGPGEGRVAVRLTISWGYLQDALAITVMVDPNIRCVFDKLGMIQAADQESRNYVRPIQGPLLDTRQVIFRLDADIVQATFVQCFCSDLQVASDIDSAKCVIRTDRWLCTVSNQDCKDKSEGVSNSLGPVIACDIAVCDGAANILDDFGAEGNNGKSVEVSSRIQNVVEVFTDWDLTDVILEMKESRRR